MATDSVLIHVSLPVFYEYEGWLFEYDRRKPFGPWPCKKDLEPRARAGRVFYAMFGRFNLLDEKEQEKYRL